MVRAKHLRKRPCHPLGKSSWCPRCENINLPPASSLFPPPCPGRSPRKTTLLSPARFLHLQSKETRSLHSRGHGQRGGVVFEIPKTESAPSGGPCLDSPEKAKWTNVPPRGPQGGVRLGDLNEKQMKKACDLLAAVLSPQGYGKVRNIPSPMTDSSGMDSAVPDSGPRTTGLPSSESPPLPGSGLSSLMGTTSR